MTLGASIATMAIIAAAMTARSAFGFGHGAFAMPLLVLALEVKTATPLLGVVSLMMSLIGAVQNWRYLHFRATAGLILGAVLGIPVGVAMLLYIDPRLTLLTLGVVLALLAIRGLSGAKLPALTSDRLGPIFGFVGGVLGGAFNLTGLPVAIFGSMRGWTPAQYRTTFNGFFLVTGSFSVIGYFSSGLVDGEVAQLFALSVIPAFLGDFAGKRLNNRMSREAFERWVWSLILATSAILIGKQLL